MGSTGESPTVGLVAPESPGSATAGAAVTIPHATAAAAARIIGAALRADVPIDGPLDRCTRTPVLVRTLVPRSRAGNETATFALGGKAACFCSSMRCMVTGEKSPRIMQRAVHHQRGSDTRLRA